MLSYQTYLFFNIDDWSKNSFQLVDLPNHFRMYIFILFIINSFLTYFYEKLFISWISGKYNERQAKKRKIEFEKMLIDGAAAL